MDEYNTPPWAWRDRALAAEKQARNAMNCLLLMAQNNAIPEPWKTVIECAYIGCGGQFPKPQTEATSHSAGEQQK